MNTLVVVQARLNSSRLPRKALADLCGKSVIQHVVERAKAIRDARVVLACPEADGETFRALHLGCDVVAYTSPRGENDVLSRFVEASGMRITGFPPAVCRVTGDCPFLAPDLLEAAIDCIEDGSDYASTRHDGGHSLWPDGMDVEAVYPLALAWAYDDAIDPSDREHVTPWIRRHASPWRTSQINRDGLWPSGVKLSIDTPDDLDFARRVMARIKPGDYGWKATLQAVREVLQEQSA